MSDTKVINFMGKSQLMTWLSLVMMAISIGALAIKGLNYGLDFTGGTQVELSYDTRADLDEVRAVLELEGFDSYEVAYFGSEEEVLIRIQDADGVQMDADTASRAGDRLVRLLSERTGANVSLARSEYVGSVVGEELKEQGGLGVIVALAMMLIYISVRFQWKFALATVAALTEDVVITLGFFAITQMTFDLTVLAAILAVIGYGLNDTVVICDRIRENFRILRKMDASKIINISLSQTLGRTAVTSLTTLMVLVILATAGGEALRGFSIALIVGVVIGTYSSLFVASKVLMLLNVSKEDLMPPKRDDEELEAIP